MTKTVDKSNLGFLGENFQMKLVKCFLEDKPFFRSIVHLLDQNMFTDEHLRTIVGILKDRYEKKNIVATYEELRIYVLSSIFDTIRRDYCTAKITELENMDLVGMDLIEENAEKFFKQQNLIKAVNKAKEIIKKGDYHSYNQIETLFKKALEVNTKDDYGWKLFDHLDEDLDENYRETISTGSKELDDALYGGIGRGELGVVVAPSGVGKTSICTGFAVAAALNKTRLNNYKGFKVLHFYFEDSDSSIRRKYFGYLLNKDAMYLSEHPEEEKKLLRSFEKQELALTENIRGKQLTTGETTASDIKRRIDSFISIGFKPDLVIVDYFECLKSENNSGFNDSEWSKEGATMRKLESICKETGVSMWVPVQGTKGSIGADFVGLMDAGGSVSKVQIGHIVLTLARTEEQKSQGKINIYIQKLRSVKISRDKFINASFNNGTGKLDLSNSSDGSVIDFNSKIDAQVTNTARRVKSN